MSTVTKRYTFAMKIKKGHLEDFRRTLGEQWVNCKRVMDEFEIENFSLWSVDLINFGYCESENDLYADTSCIEAVKEVLNAFEEYCEWMSDVAKPMPLMFYRYGDGRQKSELSYKRIFVAKLHEGMEAEYKRRHDGIMAPPEVQYKHMMNNNFTIWSDHGYIFGYSEVDSTLEKEKTQEGIDRSTKWETAMLEIMDWVTNDVDWLSHLYHPNSQCIASYK